jgi:hypothetical protein
MSPALAREPSRSSVVFFLSLSFFGSAMLSYLLGLVFPPATVEELNSVQVTVILDVAAGIITLSYWAIWKPDYLTADRPLGITILAIGIALGGLFLVAAGLLIFFLPVFGIIGVLAGGIGIGFLFLARGLWTGKEWSLEIMFVITAIGMIISIVFLLFYRTGTPILAAYQLWYLGRPHIRDFFGTLDKTTPSWGYKPLPATD